RHRRARRRAASRRSRGVSRRRDAGRHPGGSARRPCATTREPARPDPARRSRARSFDPVAGARRAVSYDRPRAISARRRHPRRAWSRNLAQKSSASRAGRRAGATIPSPAPDAFGERGPVGDNVPLVRHFESPAMLIDVVIVLGLIALNGLFAMSELAGGSSRRSRLESLAARHVRGARAALRLTEDPTAFLSTVQIGITLVGILAGAFGGVALGGEVA